MLHHLVHKVAVVRDDDHAAREFEEEVFQDIEGEDVQVVGRLIQDQEVGVAHQDHQQKQAAALTTTQL